MDKDKDMAMGMAIDYGASETRTSREFLIRHAERRDAVGFVAVERACYAGTGVEMYGETDFHRWLDTYPEGFLIAEREGGVVGYTFNLLTTFAFPGDIGRCATYALSQCADPVDMHVTGGNTMFGISTASFARGAGRMLLDAEFRLADAIGLEHFICFTRMPGFAAQVAVIERGLGRTLSPDERLSAARSYAVGCAALIDGCVWQTMPLEDSDRLWPAPVAPDPAMSAFLKGRRSRLGLAQVMRDCLRDPQSLDYGAFMVRV